MYGTRVDDMLSNVPGLEGYTDDIDLLSVEEEMPSSPIN